MKSRFISLILAFLTLSSFGFAENGFLFGHQDFFDAVTKAAAGAPTCIFSAKVLSVKPQYLIVMINAVGYKDRDFPYNFEENQVVAVVGWPDKTVGDGDGIGVAVKNLGMLSADGRTIHATKFLVKFGH